MNIVNAIFSLDDRVAHFCGLVHGVAVCGEEMRDPWRSVPIAFVLDDDEAVAMCEVCVDLVTR